jgi:ectoine hydroxylase-related dioxygenase (phytanoyl-CoA dioxygenase family)
VLRVVVANAELHPWNDGFEVTVPATDPIVVTAADRERFARDGYVVVEDLVPADLRERVTSELDALEARVDDYLAAQENERVDIAERGAITFTLHPVLRSAAARELVRHPSLLGLCHDLLGDDVRLYWDQAVYKKPEKPRIFPWHQDTGYTFTDPQAYLTCWVALTDATVDNGCPWIVPGGHRDGTLLHRWVDPIGWQCLADPPGAVPAPVRAGGAVVFSSLTPHMTGPNTTDSVRKAYIVQYAIDGAHVVDGDWSAGAPPTGRRRQDDPDRQPLVLRAGHPT